MNQIRMLYDKLLLDLKSSDISNIVIAIDGVAGSGKTTLAQKLAQDLVDSQIIHMDDLYQGWDKPFSSDLILRVISQVLDPFSTLVESQYSKYNWKSNSFDTFHKLKPSKYLILEGVGAAQSVFHKYFYKIIWLEMDVDVGFERVLRRDGEQYREKMRKFLIDQAELFAKEATKNQADYIFEGAP